MRRHAMPALATVLITVVAVAAIAWGDPSSGRAPRSAAGAMTASAR